MTIVRVFSIIGIKFAEKDFIDKAIEIKLLDTENMRK